MFPTGGGTGNRNAKLIPITDNIALEFPVGERADGPFREMVELMEQPLLQVLQRREVASPEPVPELLPKTLDGAPSGLAGG